MKNLITLTLEVTDEQQKQLVDRFIQSASAVVEQQTNEQITADQTEHNNKVDARGVPYDARFHSSAATMTNKGAWKKKKGADPEALKAYEDSFINAPTPAPAPTEAAPTPAPAPTEAAPTPAPAPGAATIELDENGNPKMPDFLKREPAPAPTAAMPTAEAAPAMPGMPTPEPEPVTMEHCIAAIDNLAVRYKTTGLDQTQAYAQAHANVKAFYGQLNITDPSVLENDESLRRQITALIDSVQPGQQ